MGRLNRQVFGLALVAMLAGCTGGTEDRACRPAEGCRPNVLWIFVDDLRPELGTLGSAHVVSPSIDRLAAEGVLFEQAYAQAPVCGASRASLLTGLRPTHRRFLTHDSRVDADAPEARTVPDLLKAAGYTTIANGKVFHSEEDDADGWSERPWRSAPDNDDQLAYALPANRALVAEHGRGPPFESADVDDDAYPNGQVATKSIADLARLADSGAPFFLAVGFWKPHLPFNAPRRYWDLYDRDRLPGPRTPDRPTDAPDTALHLSLELRTQYLGLPPIGEPIPDELARDLTHGYLAALSYTDALIGRVLAALDDLGLADDTIVVLMGDHGFLLGDHGLWTKHANFDLALRTPLVIRAPGYARGGRSAAIVEGLDVAPTLFDLLGLEIPPEADGASLVPLLADPGAPGKGFAVSQWTSAISLDPGPWFGESIRTDRWLYTEWREVDGRLRARMLYDHEADPDEAVNVAERVDPAVVDALSAELRAVTGTPAIEEP